jgi:hypothetical protein
MRDIGLVDSDSDGYIDLDGRYLICDDNGTTIDSECTNANQVFGRFTDFGGGPADRYGGAPFVLLSQGKNWSDPGPSNDEVENGGATTTVTLGMGVVPSGVTYLLKDVVAGETTFVRRPTGFADDFDDVVMWVSPSILYSKMIEAGQLP